MPIQFKVKRLSLQDNRGIMMDYWAVDKLSYHVEEDTFVDVHIIQLILPLAPRFACQGNCIEF